MRIARSIAADGGSDGETNESHMKESHVKEGHVKESHMKESRMNKSHVTIEMINVVSNSAVSAVLDPEESLCLLFQYVKKRYPYIGIETKQHMRVSEAGIENVHRGVHICT